MERINDDGIREVFCEADQKCYFLDERPDRFQYYPVDDDEDRADFMRRLIEEEAAELSSFGKE